MSPRISDKFIGVISGQNPELIERMRTGNPMEFLVLEKDEKGDYLLNGKKVNAIQVGKPRQVDHLTTHDMLGYAVMCAMTELVLGKEKVNVNAVYVNQSKFKRVDRFNGITTYQPMLVDLV